MRLSRLILAMLVVWTGGIICGHAAVRSFHKLNLNEKLALEESERRMADYDQQLLLLDHNRAKGRISPEKYQQQSQVLLLVIREESVYQNAIMVRDSALPQRARDLFETLEHAVIAVPVGIGYLVADCPQLLQFLTLIH